MPWVLFLAEMSKQKTCIGYLLWWQNSWQQLREERVHLCLQSVPAGKSQQQECGAWATLHPWPGSWGVNTGTQLTFSFVQSETPAQGMMLPNSDGPFLLQGNESRILQRHTPNHMSPGWSCWDNNHVNPHGNEAGSHCNYASPFCGSVPMKHFPLHPITSQHPHDEDQASNC